MGGEPGQVSAIGVDEPKVGASLVFVKVCFSQGEDDAAAIGRGLGVGELVDGEYVVD